jgi:histone-lysine N-methyltransferase SETD1
MGEVVRQCVADKREKAYEKDGIGSCYMFRLDLERIVDATTIGCMVRWNLLRVFCTFSYHS